MRLNEIRLITENVSDCVLGRHNGVYLRAEGNGEWSVVKLNCFEKFLRWVFGWLGCYSSTHLTTIVENLKVEVNPPEEVVQRIDYLWHKTYPEREERPLVRYHQNRLAALPPIAPPAPYRSRLPEAQNLLRGQKLPRPSLDQMNFPRIDRGSQVVAGNIAAREWLIGGARLIVGPGDIFNSGVPCIVNGAQETCLGGAGGINGAIHDAAGLELLQLCEALPILEERINTKIRCRVGNAVITGSAALGHRGIHHIIHAVGPRANYENRHLLLESTYWRIMQRAEENGIRKLAIPSISTENLFYYPFGEATEIAIRTIENYLREHPVKFDEVKLIFPDNPQDFESTLNCAWAIHMAAQILGEAP